MWIARRCIWARPRAEFSLRRMRAHSAYLSRSLSNRYTVGESLYLVTMTVRSVQLAHLTRSILARVHLCRATDALLSLSFVRGITNTNYFSPSFSLAHTYILHLPRAIFIWSTAHPVAFSIAIPAAVSVPLNLSPVLALARLHLSLHKHYRSLSRSYRHRSPADFSFSHRYSFTTAQQWGLNHTEVGGGGGSRAVVGRGSEQGSRERRWRGGTKPPAGREMEGREREREREDSGREKKMEATPLTGRCHSTESPLRSRGSLTPVAQSAWLDFRAVFHRSFRAEAPTWCSM